MSHFWDFHSDLIEYYYSQIGSALFDASELYFFFTQGHVYMGSSYCLFECSPCLNFGSHRLSRWPS